VLLGLHHVTAFAGDAQRNVDFYTRFLGLRLIKRTVNFDDPATYHFYFGHKRGAPGTLLTFFPWPTAPAGHAGAGQIQCAALAVPASELPRWIDRALAAKITCSELALRFGEPWMALCDPAGLTVELVGAQAQEARLHSVTLRESRPERTSAFLTDLLGFSCAGEEGDRTRWRLNGAVVDIVATQDPKHAKLSAGMVHHVAFRVAGDAAQLEWREKLIAAGVRVTRVIDRRYFRSIYFREPGGVLFEIATDGPGFFIDESEPGAALQLPPWLEPMRESIERRLPPVNF
jgi:glyoxalase family protein